MMTQIMGKNSRSKEKSEPTRKLHQSRLDFAFQRMPKSLDAECHFLRTPPEIRNNIYDLVYRSTAETDLLTAKPLSKALLLTCRQVYSEVKSLHRAAYQAFWRETKFTLKFNNHDAPQYRAVLQAFRALADEDLEHTTSVRLIDTSHKRHDGYDFEDGVWWTECEGERVAGMLVPCAISEKVEAICGNFGDWIPRTDLTATGRLATAKIRERVKAIKAAFKVRVSTKDEIIAYIRLCVDSLDDERGSLEDD